MLPDDDVGLIETVNAPLMGVNFRPAEAKERVKALEIGERLLLEREPSNEYDPNAVKVKTQDGFFIGYVARTNNYEVADHLSRDLPYRCEVLSFLTTLKPDMEIKLFAIVQPEDVAETE